MGIWFARLALVGALACSHQVKPKNQLDTLVKNSDLKKAAQVSRGLARNSKDPAEIIRSTRTILAAGGVASGTAASVLAVLLSKDYKVKGGANAVAEKVFTLVSRTHLHSTGARDSLRDVSRLLKSAIERVEDPMGKERLVLESITVNLLLMGGTVGVLANMFLEVQKITSDREGFAFLSELIDGQEVRDLDLTFANIAQNVDGVGKFFRSSLRLVLPEHGFVITLKAEQLNSRIAKLDPLSDVAAARFSSQLPDSQVVTDKLKRLRRRLKEATEYRFRFDTKLFYLDPGEPKPVHRFLQDVISELALEPITKYLTAINRNLLAEWRAKIISGEWSGSDLHAQLVNNAQLAELLDEAHVSRDDFYQVTKYFALVDFRRVVQYLIDANEVVAAMGGDERERENDFELARGIENVDDDFSEPELRDVIARLVARQQRLQAIHDQKGEEILKSEAELRGIEGLLAKRVAERESLVDAKEEFRASKNKKAFADAHRQLLPILEEIKTLWIKQRRVWFRANDARRLQIDLEGRLATIDERLQQAQSLLAEAQ